MNYICRIKSHCYIDTIKQIRQMKKVTTLLLTVLLLSSCSEKIIRIACIGDSITEGAGLKKQSVTSYPAILDSILGNKYNVMNCGRSATTLQRNGDFSYWNSKEFTNTFVFEPSVIVIKLGTNDTKPQNWNAANFEQDYQLLLDTLNTLQTRPKIFLVLPVPVYKTEWGINDSTLTKEVIPIIKQLAKKNELTIIDLYTGLSNSKEYFPDNIHPNENGTQKMASIVAQKILNFKTSQK